MGLHRTLLERMIKERRQTFEEFAEFAEVLAREHGESGTVSVRHLQRLVAGPRGRWSASRRCSTRYCSVA